jgi:hypothetical protein
MYEIYKKYINGRKWLENRRKRGIDISKDLQDFQERVMVPLNAKWKKLNKEELKDWAFIHKVTKMFDATIK